MFRNGLLTLALLSVLTVTDTGGAEAAGKKMKGAELTELLSGGKTIQLGGPGEGYAGELTLSADGKGSGSAKTDDGTVIKLEGVWAIKGDKFCRTWADLDGGKEVCETWVITGKNKVDVMNGKKRLGVNHW